MSQDDSPTRFAARYLEETVPLFQEYLGEGFAAAMRAMTDAYQRDATVFVCGNGGSWGTGNHMVNDLAKGTSVEGRRRLRVIGLGDNASLLTAYANDCGYDSVFVEPLRSLFRPGDLLIAISASGNSPNVVRAAEYARERGGAVIGLVGFSGGQLKELSTAAIHFRSTNYGSVEDAQLMFSHLASQYLRGYIADGASP